MTGPLAPIADQVLAVARLFRKHGIPHAVGGAVSYSFAGIPRATNDIDVNVFLNERVAEGTIRLLAPLGVDLPDSDALAELRRAGQIRLNWHGTYLDLFFAYHPFHESCAARVKRVPFGDDEIDVLSPEDITVFKILFNRARDWGDIERVVQVQRERLDLAYIRRWIGEMLGLEDSRLARFESIVDDTASETSGT